MLAVVLTALVLQDLVAYSLELGVNSSLIGLKNSRYKRDAGGTSQLLTANTGCAKLDDCLESMKTILIDDNVNMFGSSCTPISEQLLCLHGVIETSPICLNLRYYFRATYKLDMMSIQLGLFCSKYEDIGSCSMMTACLQKIKFPETTGYLAEPQYWCAVLKVAIDCAEAYKSPCASSSLDVGSIKRTIYSLCPDAIDVSAVVYRGVGTPLHLPLRLLAMASISTILSLTMF